MTDPSPSKRLCVEQKVCGQVLRLPDLFHLLFHHKIGIHRSDRCPVEALANLTCSEKRWPDAKHPMWLIGSYMLTPEHLEADVDLQEYSWLPYLEIAIEAFNDYVEDYSYCFPLEFFRWKEEDRNALFLKTFREKAQYQTPDRFQENFWQASWRILLPVVEKKKGDKLLNVVFITNQREAGKEGPWVCAIDTLYGDTQNLKNAGALLDILKKAFVPVEDPHQVVVGGVPPIAKETETVTAGRLVAFLLKCKNPHTLNTAPAKRLLEYLHTWIHNAVHGYDPNDKAWVLCEEAGCIARWRQRPRGSLAEWVVGPNGEDFSCRALGKKCTFGPDRLQEKTQELEHAEARIKELTRNLEAAQVKQNNTEHMFSALTTQVGIIRKQLPKAEARIEELANEKKALEAAQATAEAAQARAEEVVKALKKDADDHQQNGQTKIQKLRDDQARTKRLANEKIGQHERKIQELQTKLPKAEARIKELANEKQGALALNDAQAKTIGRLETKVQELQTKLQELQARIEELTNETIALKAAQAMTQHAGNQDAMNDEADDNVNFLEGNMIGFTDADKLCPNCGKSIKFTPDVPGFNAFEKPAGTPAAKRRALSQIKRDHPDCNLWWACLDKLNKVKVNMAIPEKKTRETDKTKTVPQYLMMRMAHICKDGSFLEEGGRTLGSYSSAAFIESRINRFFRILEKGESNISLVNPRTQRQHTLTYTIARRSWKGQT
jgi:hypothetical protein